ncbi:MAG TPA: four helix bundle protein [Prolixibacteraceae bacterium]|nr:four helix bundle protein [Prolixibacteraceae bacterium]
MHNYKEMKIWQKSRALVKVVYEISKILPKEELYGLTSQIRRAVVSIPANIAEGAGRGTDRYFRHFLDISKGSLFELDTLLILSNDLGYISEGELSPVLENISEIIKMMVSFQSRLV